MAPKGTIHEMIKIQRNFLWGVNSEGNKLNLELFNISLSTKWKSRCLNDCSAIWRDLIVGSLISRFVSESCGKLF